MTDPDWWRGAVIYEIYPRSFQDSNGDGIGDLAGITRRLGHVADLGVDAIWVAPFFASPMRDFGYDVADYRSVDPVFGSLDDFDALVAEAHRLGLKVVIDQILSHSSDRHPWFAESRSGRAHPRADWYVWADPKPDGSPPNNWQSVFGGPAWTWDSRRRQYYFHNFLREQPDLNLHNRPVQDELLSIMAFWLGHGVDGFRLDAVNHYVHDPLLRDNPPARPSGRPPPLSPYGMQEHLHDKNQPEVLAFLARIRALADRHPGVALLGEIGEEDRAVELMRAYTAGAEGLHMAYSFDLLGPHFTAPFLRSRIERFATGMAEGWPCWAFSNHDAIRPRTRLARPGSDEAIARLAISVLVALRGSLCLYQGEELGLPEADIAYDDLVDPYGKAMWPEFKGRDGCRTPMPWTAAERNGGFSSARPWLPIPPQHLELAADRQIGDDGSVLSHYRRMLRLRRRHSALRTGDLTFLDAPEDVLAFARSLPGETLVCAFNFAPGARTLALPPGGWVDLLAPDRRAVDGDLNLAAFGAFFGSRGR